MKRACYCRKENGFVIEHLKAVRKDGTVETEPIDELNGTYDSLENIVLSANMIGYGIVGDIEDIENKNKSKAYSEKCGENVMPIDDL